MTAVRKVSLVPIIFLAMAAASCSWTGKDGTRRSLILGIGVLSTFERVQGAARITKTTVYGLALQHTPAMSGLIFGYAESLLTQIPPRWEGELSVVASATRSMTVKASPANLPRHH